MCLHSHVRVGVATHLFGLAAPRRTHAAAIRMDMLLGSVTLEARGCTTLSVAHSDTRVCSCQSTADTPRMMLAQTSSLASICGKRGLLFGGPNSTLRGAGAVDTGLVRERERHPLNTLPRHVEFRRDRARACGKRQQVAANCRRSPTHAHAQQRAVAAWGSA